MKYYKERQVRPFEERLADLFRAMISASSDAANLIEKDNVLIKLEIFTYLFWILDYSLVVNKVDQSVREAINKLFDVSFSQSKHWSELNISNLKDFIDDRLSNYTDILQAEKRFNTDYYTRIIEYQTELIAWIKEKKKIRLGYIAVPKNIIDYKPIILGAVLKFGITAPLQEAYTSILLQVISKIQKNAVTDYFFDKKYTKK